MKWRSGFRWEKKKWTPSSIGRILPNIITMSGLFMGLTAIRFAFLQQWQWAVASVLIAGILDGLDGRLARLLKTNSDFGAELDSLADFINFGVGPSLIIYYFSLHRVGNIGWAACLFFSACMALRLARFNVQRSGVPSRYSVGVPAPAGALLILSPMMGSFVFQTDVPVWIFMLVTLGTAGMMVSRYPTFLFKKMEIPQKYSGAIFISLLAWIISLLNAPWESLLFLSCVYVITWPISGYFFYKKGL
jgi:CDP-diacylglycerol--serine O-phosphatidyltransferase